MTTQGRRDAWEKIKGNEHVKRAIEVALAGSHKITVIGNYDNGGHHINEVIEADFIECCPCGNFRDAHRTCACSPEQIDIHLGSEKYRKAIKHPIKVELCRVSVKDFFSVYGAETLVEVEKRIAKKSLTTKKELAELAISLLEAAIHKLSFTLLQIENCIDVAHTIASLDGCEMIQPEHIAEAIQYQSLI